MNNPAVKNKPISEVILSADMKRETKQKILRDVCQRIEAELRKHSSVTITIR